MFLIEAMSPLGSVNLTREDFFIINGKSEKQIIFCIFATRELAKEYIEKHKDELKKMGIAGYQIKEYMPLSTLILN